MISIFTILTGSFVEVGYYSSVTDNFTLNSGRPIFKGKLKHELYHTSIRLKH